MLTRTLTAIVALLLLVPLLIWGGVWAAAGVFALICGFSVYEMLSCCGLLKNWLLSIPAIIVSAICTIMPCFGILYGLSLFLLIPILLVAFMVIGVIFHKTLDMERLLMFFTLAVYITAGFTALSAVRAYFGLWAVAFILSVAWATDTFAYFSGMLFGKRKLCPEISPKKTIAGAIGGTLFGTLAGVIVLWVSQDAAIYGLLALPVSIISQFGDLSASVIMRRFGVKDYGKIFPGHGGVLDRFDSIIPVSIVSAVIFIVFYFIL